MDSGGLSAVVTQTVRSRENIPFSPSTGGDELEYVAALDDLATGRECLRPLGSINVHYSAVEPPAGAPAHYAVTKSLLGAEASTASISSTARSVAVSSAIVVAMRSAASR